MKAILLGVVLTILGCDNSRISGTNLSLKDIDLCDGYTFYRDQRFNVCYIDSKRSQYVHFSIDCEIMNQIISKCRR